MEALYAQFIQHFQYDLPWTAGATFIPGRTCEYGDVEWELIEPLDGRSVYAEYLSKYGEGLHHVAFDVEDFEKVTKELQSKGYENVQSGRVFGNDTYVYFNLNRGLACTAELNSNPTAPLPPPESTYP
jgi:methylmalonyl-CoA/ethylmalonyl-CoA epimerase